MDHESSSPANVADFCGFGGNNHQDSAQICATNYLGFHAKSLTPPLNLRVGTNHI
jgi:hypothetical protein